MFINEPGRQLHMFIHYKANTQNRTEQTFDNVVYKHPVGPSHCSKVGE